MSSIGFILTGCITALCLRFCCFVCINGNQEDKESLIQHKMDEIIESYELTCPQESVVCPITQEQIEIGSIIKELPCGHKFSEGIDKWVSLKNRCPICRQKIIITI